MKVECSNCRQQVLLDDSSAGQTIPCPNCGRNFTMPPAAPNAAPPAAPPSVPARELQTNVKQGAAIGGWICFGLACIFLLIPIPTWFIYAPLFLVSFILGIVAISQRRIASGVTLLLANVIGAPILFIVALAIGLATWRGALEQARQNAAHRSSIATTNQVESRLPVNEVPDPQPVSENKVPDPQPVPEPQPVAERTAAPAAPTVEKIEGAFGKKLGETFDPAQAIDTLKASNGTLMYEFSTTTGFRSFNHYYVLITPKTHKICAIWAYGPAESREAAQREQSVVMELLKQKYGSTEKSGSFETREIDQGNRCVLTTIAGFTDVKLDIRYFDKDLAVLAEEERLASDVQKADKGGL